MRKFRKEFRCMASNNENRGVNIYLNANAADDTLKQLKASATRLRNELALLPRGSEEFAEKSKILERVNYRLDSLRKEANGVRESFSHAKDELADFGKQAVETGDKFSGLKGKLNGLGKLAIGTLIGGSVLDVAKDILSQNMELSDSFAGVMKTTGLTEVQVESVNRSLQNIDTLTAKEELLGLAQVAGKLGLSSVEDVEGFVRSADKIGVALGEDLGGTEQAVNELGKLIDIFKIKEEFGIEDALLKVGSAINDLGASGTANEKNLIDFSARLAGIAPAAKISLPNVLAIAAVMDELGQSMQTSSTAVGQFIVGMGNDVPKYAKIATMEVQAFANLLRDDANEAMLRVLNASKNTGGGIAELAKNMKELNVTGSEGRAAIGALANNIDKLRDKQDEVSKSFIDGISITKEFNTANSNLAANLDKLANKFATMWENSGTRSWLTKITGWLADNRTEAQKLSEAYDEQKTKSDQLSTASDTLLKRYDKLKGQAKLNKDEQTELKSVINKIAELMPEAITGWNQYGDVLDINRRKVIQLTDAQRNLVKEMNISTVKEGNKQIESLQKSIEKDQRALTFERQNQKYQFNQNQKDKVQKEDIDPLIESISKKKAEIIDIGKQIQDLGGEVNKIGQGYLNVYVNDPATKKAGFDGMKAGNEAFRQDSAAVEKRIKELQAVINGPKSSADAAKQAEQWIGQLKKQLKVIKEQNKDAEINTPDKEKGTGKKSQAEKDRESAQKLYEKLVDEEKLFNAQRYQDQLAENDKEIALEQAKYDKLIEAWEGFRDKAEKGSFEHLDAEGRLIFLSNEKKEAIDNLRLKQEEKISEAITKIRSDMGQKMLTELDREKIRIDEHYQKLLKDAGNNEAQKAQIKEAWSKDVKDAEARNNERLQKEIKTIEGGTTGFIADEHKRRIAEIEAQHQLEIDKLREKYGEQLKDTELFKQAMDALDAKYQQKKDEENGKADKDRAKKIKDAAIQAAEDLSGALFQIGANNRQAELDAALSNIEKQREKELSNKNLSEAQKKAINDKYDKQARAEKLKAWKADKNASLLQAGINTALAVTKALPNVFLAAAAAAAGAAQIAVIAATKPPQFFHGGFTPGKKAQGWVNEPTLLTNSMGNQFTAGENHMPEYVISSEQLRDPRIANFVDMIEAGRINQIGSLTAQSPVIVQNNSDTSVLESKMDLLYQAMIAMGDKKVIMLFSEFENARDTKVKIENSVNS
ncbi:MAG TPA: hypothetical protein DCG88_11705 [Sphingobacterium sp.]|nr:hypothetical protein [Sphingobacterium sp.]